MKLDPPTRSGLGICAAVAAVLACRGVAAAQETKPPAAPVQEIVTVTATRLPVRLQDLAGATTVTTAAQISLRPSLGIDEALRWEPSFSLLRRTPARAAHPTAQGLNLRGIAPSGTSRALVLIDGAPATDAFGGWVYWNRVPQVAIEQVELASGGGSAPWGSGALAGALQFVARRPSAGNASVRLTGASQGSARLGMLGSSRRGDIGALLATELFHTDGYVAVAPRARGPVDAEVASRHASGLLRFSFPGDLLLSLDGLAESRDNGTAARVNDTRAFGASLLWEPTATRPRGWQTAAFARTQRFDSRFSAVVSNRTREIATLDQRVRSKDLGVRGHVWSQGNEVTVSAGGDGRAVSGSSDETVLRTGFRRRPGGRQQLGGLFVSLDWRAAPAWSLEASVRGDGWRDRPRDRSLSSRSRTTLSPRLGLVLRASDRLRLRASAYAGFRAPTLNELYRQFRVGNVVTLANPDLVHERLTGVEGGMAWNGVVGATRLQIDADLYYNRLTDAVINATLGTSGSLVQRQRRNLGESSVTGAELRMEAALGRWRAGFAGSWFRARIGAGSTSSEAALASIRGNHLPQVPSYRVRLSGRYASDDWTALVALLASGKQYEDDRNELPLDSGVSLEAALHHTLRHGIEVSVSAQNLLGDRLQVARTPVLQLGPPRTLTLTLAWQQ